jgi:4a-hydroxytetrahydrobiopterin dehydratase
MSSPSELIGKSCAPCPAGTPALTEEACTDLLPAIHGWEIQDGELCGTFSFKNYYQTVAFVNALAYIAHREDHHPDVQFGYKSCTVRYATHSIGGLSMNDFICAAKINALV